MFEAVVIAVLIGINGFFSLAEAAFLSSRKSLLTSYLHKGKRNAAFILKMMDEPESFLASIQVCITLIGVISGAFGGLTLADDFSILLRDVPYLSRYADVEALVLVVSLITYLSIVIGELVPKTLAMNNPEKIALFSTPPVRVVMFIFSPMVSLLSSSTRAVLWLSRAGKEKSKGTDPIREIVSMIRMAATNKDLNRDQERILLNTINMTKVFLKDIMVEKKDIKFLDTRLSIMDAFLQIHIHHHTRYPLAENNDPEKITGYVNFKDIINVMHLNPSNPTLSGLCRPVTRLSVSDRIIDVLPKLIRNNQHIAVVNGKNGEVAGLVTLEDLVESILGDISDEYAALPEYCYRIADNVYVVGGGCPLAKIRSELGISFGGEPGRIADWAASRTEGAVFIERKYLIEGCSVTVKKIKGTLAYELLLELKPR
jgi:putative hemolysin